MDLTARLLTIAESQEYLALNGVEWTQVWIRIQIGYSHIKSELHFNSRVIPRVELDRIIRKRKDKR